MIRAGLSKLVDDGGVHRLDFLESQSRVGKILVNFLSDPIRWTFAVIEPIRCHDPSSRPAAKNPLPLGICDFSQRFLIRILKPNGAKKGSWNSAQAHFAL